jgi:hypothetical protein
MSGGTVPPFAFLKGTAMTDTNHDIRESEFQPVTLIDYTVHWLENAVI